MEQKSTPSSERGERGRSFPLGSGLRGVERRHAVPFPSLPSRAAVCEPRGGKKLKLPKKSAAVQSRSPENVIGSAMTEVDTST